ncbi:MAG: amino acid permease, partial [Planctomycetes bacterium]|nr:amino acid permease [Planctomycetota bacterium]
MNNATETSAQTVQPRLARALGLTALTLYGVGDMLGAGIYALVGKVAGVMGNAVWMAFLVSMVAALLTGLSYASLGSRYPRAAGAAYITHRAYRWPFFSYLIGLAVMASGLTSMATQSRAFSGYFSGLVGHLPAEVLIVGFILVLSFVNFWGIRESSWLNLVCTLVEMAGLGIVIVVAAPALGSVNYLTIPRTEGDAIWPILLSGSVLT